MELYFTVARLRNRTYQQNEVLKFVKQEVPTAYGTQARFYAYENGETIPYGIMEASPFHLLPQTKVMNNSLANTLPDNIEVVIVEPNNPHGLVKAKYNGQSSV